MILAYNTNGFAHHRLDDALAIIAELGYSGIAWTPDVHHLDPLASSDDDILAFGEQLRERGLRVVVETGARFLLDPRRKHQPTLISPSETERETRIAFLWRCISVAELLGAECVSFWSGSAADPREHTTARDELLDRLADSCRELVDFCDGRVRLAFEPEPGHFIETLDQFTELHDRIDDPSFGLTMDVGHLLCTGELPISQQLKQWQTKLFNVHVEDMRRGVHDHLAFGEGDVDFADVFAGLRAANYSGMVSVELSRHSHNAVETASRARVFLKTWIP